MKRCEGGWQNRPELSMVKQVCFEKPVSLRLPFDGVIPNPTNEVVGGASQAVVCNGVWTTWLLQAEEVLTYGVWPT